MHVDCWIQQVTTRVGAVTCWIQQSLSPKQVVGFSCLFNSEVDQFINKVIVCPLDALETHFCPRRHMPAANLHSWERSTMNVGKGVRANGDVVPLSWVQVNLGIDNHSGTFKDYMIRLDFSI